MGFDEQFEFADYQGFIDEFNLRDDINVVMVDGEGMAGLTDDAQREVKEAYDNFMNGNWDDEFRQIAADMTNEFEDVFKEEFKAALIDAVSDKIGSNDVDDHVKEIMGDLEFDFYIVSLDAVDDFAAFDFIVRYKDMDERYHTQSSYQFEEAVMEDAAENWNWAAWLGIPESPFYDTEWFEAYAERERNMWFAEAADVEPANIHDAKGDSLSKSVENFAEEIVEEYL